MKNLDFKREQGQCPTWIAVAKFSSGDEASVTIGNDNNGGDGWSTYISVYSKNCTESWDCTTTLTSGCEKETVRECLEFNSVSFKESELNDITAKVIELVKNTSKRGCAKDDYFGI